MNSSEQTETLVFDHLPLAVVKVNQALDFIYANSKAREWLGHDLVTKNLRDLVPVDLWDLMVQHLEERQRGEGGFYDMQFKQSDGQYVPVKIAGIPLRDSQGKHAGSVGIILNMLFDEVADTIHLAISETRDGPELLDKVASAVSRVVPFDYFGVSRYSADLQHTMSFHHYVASDVRVPGDVRWWRIPAPFRQGICEPRVVGDFPELMNRPELAEYRNHPTIEAFLARGYNSFLRMPVFTGGRLAAAVVLFSRQRDYYSNNSRDQLRRLPLEQAVQTALQSHKFAEQQFRSTLLRSLLTCQQPVELAELLVTDLAKHHGWSHVAIFRVDDAAKAFRLVAQHSLAGVKMVPDYRQPLDQGVLGHVLKTGKSVNIPDLRKVDQTDIIPCAITSNFRSELCLPIMRDKFQRIRMLLNVEDETESAFSNDELAELDEVVKEIQPALLRLGRQFVLESAFQSSPDAILVADALGSICEANPAAAQLLKYPAATNLLQQPLMSLFSSEADLARLTACGSSGDRPTRLLARDGSFLEALIEVAHLPEVVEVGEYITIRDMAPVRRLQRLEAIGEFYYELAAQTATPLSLVKTWLRRLHSAVADNRELHDLVAKALLQLKQVEITHDRMQLYDEEQARRIPTDRIPVDLVVELRLLLQEFPRSDSTRIEVSGFPTPVLVNVDRMQVAFMFKTILAYLLRFLPPGQETKIGVRVSANERVHVIISGIAPAESVTSEQSDPVARAKFHLALGEPLLRTFAANNGATYRGREYDNEQIIFRIDFDAAQGERP